MTKFLLKRIGLALVALGVTTTVPALMAVFKSRSRA